MAVYSVFEPPARDGETDHQAQRFAFVYDGFSWGAFIFGPFWMLRHRLILVLAGWLVLIVAVAIVSQILPVPRDAELVSLVLLALLIGFEGSTLRAWTLRRRGWRDLGIVVGDDLEVAERRFFDDWVTNADPAMMQSPRSRYRPGGYAHEQEVIGLFPDAGAHR
jgi:hypothetical protein